MSINIFSGSGSPGKSKAVNRASNSVRAKAARAALADPGAEVSNSGTTAVSTKSTLAKVGNAVGKIAGVASKFLPGLGGTIAGAISNLFNDPEWWQSVPGDALTLNEPLRFISENGRTSEKDIELATRCAIMEVTTVASYAADNSLATMEVAAWPQFSVILPTEQMITQYLMPEIRKVVNAIPLQEAASYAAALKSAATIYALWRQLRKFDYMCKHGQTYLASMNDSAFPLFQTENAAWLQSTINRLEEYLRANVRLPHTLCEYLSWRFGRVYKSNASAKAALVLYDVLPLEYSPTQWDAVIATQMNIVAGESAIQHANTDLYNTYFDHDYMVEVRDDTQFKYDTKEFMLRLNLSGGGWQTGPDVLFVPSAVESIVAIDSSLDNPTAFMASTVSATGRAQDGKTEVLFPVSRIVMVYIPSPQSIPNDKDVDTYYVPCVSFNSPNNAGKVVMRQLITKAKSWNGSLRRSSTLWRAGRAVIDGASSSHFTEDSVVSMILLKSVDMYNCHADLPIFPSADAAQKIEARSAEIDATTLSIDAGAPTMVTINTEHIYAFANLVDIGRKHSMSYKQAEHLVARDTAELIDKLDVGVAGGDK